MGLCCSSGNTVDDHHTNHPLEDEEESHSISTGGNLHNTTLESITISLHNHHGKSNNNNSVTTSIRNQQYVHSSSEEDDPTSPKKNQKRKKKTRSKKTLTRKYSKTKEELTSSFGENSPNTNSPRTNYYYYEDIINDVQQEDADSDDQHQLSRNTHARVNSDLTSLKIPSLATDSSYSSAVKYSSIMKGKLDPTLGSLVSNNSTSSQSTNQHHHVPSSPSLLTLSLQQQQIRQHMDNVKRKQGASRRTLSEYQQNHLENPTAGHPSILSFNERKTVMDSKKQLISDFKKPAASNLVVQLVESEDSEEEDMDISDEDESLDSIQQFAKIQQETGSIRKNPKNKEKRTSLPPNSLDLSSGTNSWVTIPNNLPKVNKVKTSSKTSKNQVDSDTTLLFKAIFIGDGEVGKSSCLSRFEGNTFSSSTRKTVGLEFTTRFIDNTTKTQANNVTAASPHTSNSPQASILFTNKHKIQLQFWDMGYSSYQEEALVREYLKDIQAIICVYSINSVSSFERLKQLWNTQVLPQLIKNQYLPHVKIVLLGNKTDLDCERSVDYIQGLEFARAMNRSILNSISSSPSPTTIPQKFATAFDEKTNNELKTYKNDFAGLTNNVAASFEDNSLTGNSISSTDDCDKIDAVKFFECSAKSGQNLETSIQTLAHDLDGYFSNYLL